MAQKPSIPKGTRDFGQVEMARRNYIFDTIKGVFQLYGFQQIETPAMENLSTLLGKYGEEGDKLLFRIQNSGEKAALAPEKGLRYDLTVPFARYVVQHREELAFPFKRFQIQPVWRADRPQKGRYREFYQCDVDVIGSDSLVGELELIQIVEEVYRRLGINVCLHINNRKVLAGIAEVIGAPDKMIDITVAIDKLDKIGVDAVNAELVERGLSDEAVKALQPILNLSGTTADKLGALRTILASSEVGLKGVEELETLFGLTRAATEQLAPSLADWITVVEQEEGAREIQIAWKKEQVPAMFDYIANLGIQFAARRVFGVPYDTTDYNGYDLDDFYTPTWGILCGTERYSAEIFISRRTY